MAALSRGTGAVALAISSLVAAGCAQAAPGPAPRCERPLLEERAGAGLHAPWDRLLRSFVEDGFVDYACFAAHRGILDRYLERLAAVDPEKLPQPERKALWIDAYNAFTVALILEHYPGIASIKEIPRADRWLAARWVVGGRRHSLDEIEHRILRPRFHDPRIHFAIVCASKSCPDLASEAYVAGRLDAQLDRAARRFLGDETKGLRAAVERGWLGGERPTLRVSAIFDWFAEDFERAAGSVVAFVEPFLEPEDRAFVAAHRDALAVRFLSYDWSLNGR